MVDWGQRPDILLRRQGLARDAERDGWLRIPGPPLWRLGPAGACRQKHRFPNLHQNRPDKGRGYAGQTTLTNWDGGCGGRIRAVIRDRLWRRQRRWTVLRSRFACRGPTKSRRPTRILAQPPRRPTPVARFGLVRSFYDASIRVQ